MTGSGSVVWESGTTGRGISSAAIDDFGNFRLKNGSFTVWSTFENPTDTVLPGQNFSVGNVLRNGPYSFSLLRAGNLTLRWNNSVVYWNKGLNSSIDPNPWKNVVRGIPSLNFSVSLVSPVLRLEQTGILSISDPMLPSSVKMAYSSDFGDPNDMLRFLKLDRDGNLRIYSFVRGSMTSAESWAAIEDQCLVFGYCGNMGICYYNDYASPVCGCPSENFERIDQKDGRRGCKRKVEIEDCPRNSTLLELRNTQFLNFSEAFIATASACRSKCLWSDSCVVSTFMFDGTATCYLKNSTEFVEGYQAPALPSTSFVKVCAPVLPNSFIRSKNDGASKDPRSIVWILLGIIFVTAVTGLACQGGLWWWCFRNNPNAHGLSGSSQYVFLEYVSGTPIQFSHRELQRLTRGFADILGVGRFGSVYRGILANGTIVAVKQLKGIGMKGVRDFRAEVASICSTHHLNLVRVIGYCSERSNRILVYEFVKRGSLGRFLFGAEDERSGRLLDWAQRFKIALGTAKGMLYLHEECQHSIIHYNLRPENILLDEDFNAKVSDFGLLKLTSGSPDGDLHNALSSSARLDGYLAPEWLLSLPITSKSDVYSFGIILLEIVSGRRNSDVSMERNERKLLMQAYQEIEKGNVCGILDEKIRDEEVDLDEVKRVLEVSFWCTQDQPSHRPRMGKIVQMLEGVIKVEKPPFDSEVSLSKRFFTSNTVTVSSFTRHNFGAT